MSDTIEMFGYHWRLGRSWGLAHPEDICYADDSQVHRVDGSLYLGIAPRHRCFFDKEYPWAIGYVSSTEHIKYGYLEAEFTLPIGARNLWPAIWLTDCETWPPEIDIMEAWSGQQDFPLQKRGDYRRWPLLNHICPCLHWGTVDDHRQKSGGFFGKGTPWFYIRQSGMNRCSIRWTPERIEVFYNDHLAMRVTDPKLLEPYNKSRGMEIHLNNYVTNDFTYNDFLSIRRNELVIHSLTYSPWKL